MSASIERTEKRKILNSIWFTNWDGCIGIVAAETFGGTWKAYIGIVRGDGEDADAQYVAAWGNGLLPEQAHGFFPGLDIEKYKKD